MIVSHSNMKSFQKCEMRFYFDTKLSLRPKVYPAPIEVGIFGHTVMEVLFKAILQGMSYDEAVNEATHVISANLMSDDELRLDKAKIFRNVLAFGAHFMQQPWKIIYVEQGEFWPVDDDQEFAFTPDIVAEWTTGPKKGLPFVLDYKFTGQYWNDRQINTAQQLPKYVVYLNKKYDWQIRHAGLVMLNTRARETATGSDLFLLKWVPISKPKLANIERENEILVHRIEPYFRMNPDEYKMQVVRTTDEFQCKMCWFADDLCPMDLNDEDWSRAAAANYKKNDYGYN